MTPHPKQKMAAEQSLADLDRREWARPLVPHLINLACSACSGGLMRWVGRSYQDGMGPLINIHECTKCDVREDLAGRYYPHLAYRDRDGRDVNMPPLMEERP